MQKSLYCCIYFVLLIYCFVVLLFHIDVSCKIFQNILYLLFVV